MQPSIKQNLFRWLKISGEIFLLLLIVAGVLGAILKGYSVTWTGFGDFMTPAGEFSRGKTLWDWFELLIIPLSLLIGGYLLNRAERDIERLQAKERADREQHRHETQTALEREIALDRQQEAALQSYLDRMAELLLKENLRNSENQEVKYVAAIRTLTILRGLDGKRKGLVFSFLRESGLLDMQPSLNLNRAHLGYAKFLNSLPNRMIADTAKQSGLIDHHPIISLDGADFSYAELTNANLGRITLKNTDFTKANLSKANLIGSDLSNGYFVDAHMSHARLSGTNLRHANLIRADLAAASLNAAYLGAANLNNANLMWADFEGAELFGAQLDKANLCYASLEFANLRSANLAGANLKGADLEGALLSYTNLESTNLLGSNITKHQLDSAISLKNAIMPDGAQHG